MIQTRERIAVIVLLGMLLYSSITDILEDRAAGDGLSQIALDLFIVGAIGMLLAYIYILEPWRTRHENRSLAKNSAAQKDDLARLSQISRKQLEGLGAYIKAQFDEWGLTESEQDVALMLLKGYSMKEISGFRSVSERTTRQQATTIYGKANLSGRTGLSAYFLEDLLLPVGEN